MKNAQEVLKQRNWNTVGQLKKCMYHENYKSNLSLSLLCLTVKLLKLYTFLYSNKKREVYIQFTFNITETQPLTQIYWCQWLVSFTLFGHLVVDKYQYESRSKSSALQTLTFNPPKSTYLTTIITLPLHTPPTVLNLKYKKNILHHF